MTCLIQNRDKRWRYNESTFHTREKGTSLTFTVQTYIVFQCFLVSESWSCHYRFSIQKTICIAFHTVNGFGHAAELYLPQYVLSTFQNISSLTKNENIAKCVVTCFFVTFKRLKFVRPHFCTFNKYQYICPDDYFYYYKLEASIFLEDTTLNLCQFCRWSNLWPMAYESNMSKVWPLHLPMYN